MTVLVPQSIEELSNIFVKSGIDTLEYGKGEAKDLEDLFGEIKEEDCYLELNEKTQELMRVVKVANAKIFYQSNEGTVLELFEDRQEFKDSDGKITRVRKRNLPASMMEKFSSGESPIKAMLRGMKEELDVILEEYQYVDARESYKKIVNSSPSYPGLESEYHTYAFDVLFTDDQYKARGYVEKQEKKDIYFPWRERILS